jgi:hypothetical protein
MVTTKERCLEALKDNEFFQYAMKANKMVVVTHKYEPWVVIDDFMFGNQYNAINSEGKKERIYDSALCYIFNDKRLNNFYVCEQGQGTLEECQQKIDAYRSNLNQCKNCGKNGGKCFYWQALERLSNDTKVVYDDTTNQETEIKTTIWRYGCNYKDYTNSGKQCQFDINSVPQLCTDSWKKDFFVQHPEGIPDQMSLRDFIARHADEFNITARRWSEDPPSAQNGFRYDGKFGSYTFEASQYNDYFVLENNNNHFYFRYDLKSHNFIIGRHYRDIGYDVVQKFVESRWDHLQRKSISQPIACWDKFIKWWHSVIDAYLIEQRQFKMEEIML